MNYYYRNRNHGLIKATVTATAGVTEFEEVSNTMSKRRRIILALAEASLFDKIWYITFAVLGLISFILAWIIEGITFGLIFSSLSLILYMLSGNLLAKGKVTGLYIEVVNTIVYVTVCFIAGIYGEVIINTVFYLPLAFIAIVNFSKNKSKEEDEVIARKMNVKLWIGWSIATISGVIAIWVVLNFVLGQRLAFVNASVIMLFVVGTFLRNGRYKEFWYFYTVGDILSVLMWIMLSLSDIYTLPIAVSTIASLTNNFNGMMIWRTLYKKNEKSVGKYLALRPVNIKKVVKLRRRFTKLKWNEEIDSKARLKAVGHGYRHR